MQVHDFSTKAKEHEFAEAQHGDSIAFRLLRTQSANIVFNISAE